MNYLNLDEKKFQSFEYETTIQSESDGCILGVCELGKAEIQLINDKNNYSSYKGSWIKTIHGSLYIYDVAPVQERVNIKLSCYDIKYKLDTPYDSSKHTFPCTLKEWRNSIFDACSVEYDDSDFPNSSLILEKEPYVGDNASNREVVSFVAQAGASLIITDSNDKFYFVWFDNTIVHTATDWSSLTTEKDYSVPINCVVFGRGKVEDNVFYPEQKPTNPVEFRIDNNYILDPQDTTSSQDKRYETIVPIYNQLNDFCYLIFDIRSTAISNKLSIKLGQKIKYKDIWDNELQSYIMTKKVNWLGGSLEDDNNYEVVLSARKVKESSTDLSYSSSMSSDISRVERKTDKNAKKIEDLVSEVTNSSEKVAKMEIDVNSIKESVQKTLSITKTVQNKNKLVLDDCSNDYLNYLKIRGDISLLFGVSEASYGHDLLLDDNLPLNNNLTLSEGVPYELRNGTLYGSDTLFGRNSNLIIKNGNDIQKIKLPIDYLNYIDEETYDEFAVEKKEMFIIRRVGIDENGEKYKLSFETKQYLGTLDVILKEGTNEIYLESFNNATLECTYMIKNDYTNTFATKVELQAGINTTAESVLIEAQKKIDDLDVVSKLNVSPEIIEILGNRLVIDTSNFKLDEEGTAKMKNGEFQGKITGSSIQLNNPSDVSKGNFEILDSDGSNYWARSDRNYLYSPDKNAYIGNETCGQINGDYIARSIWSGNDWTGETAGSVFTTVQNTHISTPEISADNINNNSLEQLKKNFEPFEKALDILMKTDFYRYNLKKENDNCKKHIGCVIGKDYNVSEEILSKDNKSVDLYSFITVCAQSIKEIYKEIEVLKNEK